LNAAGTVRVVRGDRVESLHRFAWRACDTRGRVRGGEDIGPVFLRSAAKPFQALPSVRAGVLERFGLDERHLAVGCASHGGDDQHLARVADILVACGVGEDALGCGALAPRDPRAAATLSRPPRRIHHNCSGKHALGIALCVAEGWPRQGYFTAGHPLQQAMRVSIAEATGVPAADLLRAVDGCGMQTYAVALDGLAAAFGRLAGGALGSAGDRVAEAMGEHPWLVGYPGSIDTEIMAATPGVVAKVGAEAVIAIGTPDGRGLALKVLDGSARAVDPAAVICARQVLGLAVDTPALRALASPEVRNSRGDVVGRLEATLGAAAPMRAPGSRSPPHDR
jgi:L-asparaginase II